MRMTDSEWAWSTVQWKSPEQYRGLYSVSKHHNHNVWSQLKAKHITCIFCWTLVVLFFWTRTHFYLFILAHPWSLPWNVSGWVVLCFAFGLYRSNWIQRRQKDEDVVKTWSKSIQKPTRNGAKYGILVSKNHAISSLSKKKAKISSVYSSFSFNFCFKTLALRLPFVAIFTALFFLLQGENDRKKQLFVPYFESWPMTIWRLLMNAINAS